MGAVQGKRAWTCSASPQTYHTVEGERAQDHTHDTGWQSTAHTPWLRSIASTIVCLLFSLLTPRLRLPLLSCLFARLRRPNMASGTLPQDVTGADLSGGTGARFARAVIIVAGVCALVASLVTFV
jgi:hypothetical protein